jgi:hypothetical protein
MEQQAEEDDYIDFLVTIKEFCKGKSLIQSDAVIDSLRAYDVHAYVCCTHRDFEVVLSSGNWAAFIFKDKVYTYPITCNEDILTDFHIQTRLN